MIPFQVNTNNDSSTSENKLDVRFSPLIVFAFVRLLQLVQAVTKRQRKWPEERKRSEVTSCSSAILPEIDGWLGRWRE